MGPVGYGKLQEILGKNRLPDEGKPDVGKDDEFVFVYTGGSGDTVAALNKLSDTQRAMGKALTGRKDLEDLAEDGTIEVERLEIFKTMPDGFVLRDAWAGKLGGPNPDGHHASNKDYDYRDCPI